MKEFFEEYAEFLLKNYRFLREKAGRAADLHAAVTRLECAAAERGIESLPEFEAEVMRDAYIEGESWQDIMDKRYISHTTLARFRKKAIAAIAGELIKTVEI